MSEVIKLMSVDNMGLK